MDASLQPLLDIVSTLDFEEFGRIALTAATWEHYDVVLHLAVHQLDQEDQRWRLYCREVRRSRIEIGSFIDVLRIETEHPLLLPHIESSVELYFSSRPSNPDATIGQLVEAHHAVVGSWFDFLHFFNLGPKHSLRAMLDGGFGKLADGPKSLVGQYAEVLRSCGVAVSSPASRRPVWWNGSMWVEEVEPLLVVVMGASYFVSPTVSAERD